MPKMTLEDYITKYGPDKGPELQKLAQRRVYASSLEGLIERFGPIDGPKRFEESRAKHRRKGTLEGYIERYGEIEGPIKYKEKNSKLSIGQEALKRNGYTEEDIEKIRTTHSRKSARTLERDIEKYGVEEGTRRFEEWQASHRSRSNRCPEFWIQRGLTAEEAKLLISERQKMLSTLEGFIVRYGSEQGTQKYYKNNGHKTRNLFGKSVSLLETKFFEMLSTRVILGAGCQQRVTIEDRTYRCDYVDDNHKLIIEVFGDFWHMNPNKFGPDDVNAITKEVAKDRWVIDNNRVTHLQSSGYQVLVIWEDDIYNDIDKALVTASNFLQGNNTNENRQDHQTSPRTDC